MSNPRQSPLVRTAAVLTGVFLLVWLTCVGAMLWMPVGPRWWPLAKWVCFSVGAAIGLGWLLWATVPSRRSGVVVGLTASLAFVLAWPLAVHASRELGFAAAGAWSARLGTAGLFVIGLLWSIVGLERIAQRFEALRRERWLAAEPDPLVRASQGQPAAVALSPGWNPLDPQAWNFGQGSPRLNQSVAGLTSYVLLFFLLFLLATQVSGCREVYEMPGGGGEQKAIPQTVKVKKIIRKKFVVNPFSALSFKVPPIDDVQLQIEEETAHRYNVGYGKGAGSGFAGGTQFGKVRFIRLEYSGGDWDQDFGVGADENMLREYQIRTSQKTAIKTESRTIGQLKNFPLGKSPPMVFLTGQRNISLTKDEVATLREYLLEKHGMLFGDNGGSRHFHNQFVSMMGQVLPDVRPVPIALDDVIHRVPYRISFVPYVAPHGGTKALGWRVDGRWVCYYHPGDIADAWATGHAGVKPEIWESCYRLGTNVIFYAHSEYAKWLEARGLTQ